MYESLNDKISSDTKKGKESEKLFKTLMTELGYRCNDATDYQNMNEHWDVCTVKEIDSIKVFERIDVKGLKDSHDVGYTWAELKNVLGRDGWLCSEFMDTIVFEKNDSFEFVNRNNLLTFILEKVKIADSEDENGDTIYFIKEKLNYYRRYRRSGRKDLLVKVPFKDIEHLIDRRLYKDGRLVRII
jgi:hypothetical protein